MMTKEQIERAFVGSINANDVAAKFGEQASVNRLTLLDHLKRARANVKPENCARDSGKMKQAAQKRWALHRENTARVAKLESAVRELLKRNGSVYSELFDELGEVREDYGHPTSQGQKSAELVEILSTLAECVSEEKKKIEDI